LFLVEPAEAGKLHGPQGRNPVGGAFVPRQGPTRSSGQTKEEWKMSMAQALALRFELAHAANNCRDQWKRRHLLVKMGQLDEKIKAGVFRPPEDRKRKR